MTFANDCANCCFFVQNWCAKKEKFCVSFRKNCAKVLRMETLSRIGFYLCMYTIAWKPSFELKTVFCYKSQVTQNITFKPSYEHFCNSTEFPIKCEANRSRGFRVMFGHVNKQTNRNYRHLWSTFEDPQGFSNEIVWVFILQWKPRGLQKDRWDRASQIKKKINFLTLIISLRKAI